ncbi:putative C6 transcription factor [Aspergillus ellipticus CBS 707.79]|uniref:Putative C6 transcription factor n=1 Tax=Aspergillus ellipticus CBS 707.79 TaxID=1448320 RepID=A0A319D9N3_9EURO|nr:putative C6 transcription factor [Aspergillus ellipticus CBS 707.79]
MARKCSLPARAPAPGTSFLPNDAPPKEETDDSIEGLALRAFFYDYCVPLTNYSLSRGFLHGLETIVCRRGLSSDVAQACKAVAFASHGIKLQRPSLIDKAGSLYQKLITSLARAMNLNDLPPRSPDVLIIVMLLGVYEMIVADNIRPGYHDVHAGGMAAVLRMENSPLGLIRSVQSSHPLLTSDTARGFLFVPHAVSRDQELDDILLHMDTIWEKTMLISDLSSEDLRILQKEADTLNERLTQWQDGHPTDSQPTTVGQVAAGSTKSPPEVGYWPGNTDMYFDLYVAGAWNISRVARCFLIDLITKISDALQDGGDYTRETSGAMRQIDDIMSSIPYHLCDDMPCFLQDIESSTVVRDPGRAVGGLLLMHPIYVMSQLDIVPPETKEYVRRCLAWIGTHMGIGEANRLANTEEIQMQGLAPGCMIVWAGFLL